MGSFLESLNPFLDGTLRAIPKRGEKPENTTMETANEQDEPEELDSWTTVVNIKRKKWAKKAEQGVMQPPKTLRVPKELRTHWFRNGCCLKCGAKGHYAKDCKLRGVGVKKPMIPQESVPTQAPKITSETSCKRKPEEKNRSDP